MKNTMYILQNAKGTILGVFSSEEKLNKAKEYFYSHPINENEITFTIELSENVYYDIDNMERQV